MTAAGGKAQTSDAMVNRHRQRARVLVGPHQKLPRSLVLAYMPEAESASRRDVTCGRRRIHRRSTSRASEVT